jgi:YHS domain-containing protein
MMKLIERTARGTLVAFFLAAIAALPAAAGEKMVNAGPDNVAIKGYDTVAYFTDGRAMKGKPQFVYAWNGAQWRFASAAHRDMFASNPERYAPQFGEFCSMGLALGVRAIADPEVWKIVDNKLYLYVSRDGRDKFLQNTPENIKKAEANWQHYSDLPSAAQK